MPLLFLYAIPLVCLVFFNSLPDGFFSPWHLFCALSAFCFPLAMLSGLFAGLPAAFSFYFPTFKGSAGGVTVHSWCYFSLKCHLLACLVVLRWQVATFLIKCCFNKGKLQLFFFFLNPVRSFSSYAEEHARRKTLRIRWYITGREKGRV